MLLLACTPAGPPTAEQIAAMPEPAAALNAADELTRLAALRSLAEAGRLPALCPQLDPGPAQESCRRLGGRPHLRVAPTPLRAGPRSAPGPAAASLVPDPQLRSALLELPPDRGDCPDGAPPCLTTAALSLETEPAVSRCLAITEEVGRKECLFRVAEARAETPDSAAEVAELCLAALDFAPRCLGHTTNREARAAVARYVLDGQLSGLTRTADALAAPWAGRDDSLGIEVRGRFWSAAMEALFAWMPTPGGAAFAGLPAEALPHARAALVQRLMTDAPGAYPSLAAWTAAAQAALEAPTPPLPWPGAPPAPLSKVALWTRDEGEADARVPAAHLRETSRRAFSEDPAIDLSICVLEAAAREPRADTRALLQEGAAHPDPLVRWTAERLGQARAAPPR